MILIDRVYILVTKLKLNIVYSVLVPLSLPPKNRCDTHEFARRTGKRY